MTVRPTTVSPERILARQRARPPVPGSNLRGERLGAAWIYLLPSLELGVVHVEGDPDDAIRRTLATQGGSISWSTGTAAGTDGDAGAAAATDRIDLAVIRRHRQASLAGALRRIRWRLNPDGCVLLEAQPTDLASLDELAAEQGLAIAARFDTAPAAGELVTATAAGDTGMAAVILERGLYAAAGQRTGRWLPRRLPRRMRLVAARAIDRTGNVTRRVRFRAPGPERQAVDVLLRPAGDALPDAVDAGPGETSDPPAYLVDIARTGGIDLHGASWALVARGEYASQKPIFLIARRGASAIDLIVKTTRSPDHNDRLEAERAALLTLVELGGSGWERFDHPRALFAAEHAGLAFLGESAVAGDAFEDLVRSRQDDDLVGVAVDALIELGSRSATPATGPDHAEALDPLVEQFAATWPLAPAERRVLADDMAVIRAQDRLPAVFAHGDPGTWNLLVTPDGRMGLLDWEAAEELAPPAWDLARLIHSYTLLRPGGRGRIGRAREHLVVGSPLTPRLADAVARYRDAMELAPEIMPALLRLAWVGRAVKEINRLHPAELRHGHHARLVRLLLRPDPPAGWRRLTGS